MLKLVIHDWKQQMKRSSFSEFVEKARETHGTFYTYPIQDWGGYRFKVTVICPIHGEFKQAPSNHLAGSDCPACVKDRREVVELDWWGRIRKGVQQYDIKASSSLDEIHLRCDEHGDFVLNRVAAIRGTLCPECSKEASASGKRVDLGEWVRRARGVHGDQYAYSGIRWKRGAYIKVVCSEHGEFEQLARNHIKGQGCPVCAKDKITGRPGKNLEEYIEQSNKTHEGKFSYKGWSDENSRTLTVVCPVHGEFSQLAKDHARGVGCRKCALAGTSRGQQQIEKICRDLGVKCETDYKFIGRKELDIFFPTMNKAIEFNGTYWHSTAIAKNLNIYRKKLLAERQGITVLNIYEDELKFSPQVVEKTVKHFLGMSKKVNARQCALEVIEAETANIFYEDNHLQGGVTARLHLALYCSDELVSAMSFNRVSSVRGVKADPSEFELVRFASKYSVIGAASKLFSYFIKTNPQAMRVISYSDSRAFSGGVYGKMGFYQVGKTRPDYYYVRSGSPTRHHKSKFTRVKLEKLLGVLFDPKESERQNTERAGWYRIYDCGKTKWEWRRGVSVIPKL